MPQGIYIPQKDYFHTQSYMLAEIITLFSFNYRECTTEISGVQDTTQHDGNKIFCTVTPSTHKLQLQRIQNHALSMSQTVLPA